MDDFFRQIELEKIDEILTNFREDCRTNCRLVKGLSKEDIYVHTSPAAHVPKSCEKKEQQPPMSFEKLPHKLSQPFMRHFDFEKYGWQIPFLPEVGQEEIITDMRWYDLEQAKLGKPIKDMVTWCKIFTWMMKKWIFKHENQERRYANA